ncbi:HAD-like protein, partial [Parathielavia hyrcaniae]
RDAISAPSAASGGIPDPTDEYLRCASFVPCLLDKPKPILVVIDLNGTLLYRPHKRNAFTFVERPLAGAFLQRCVDRHHVVIWSSARPDNVRRMCEQLLPAAYMARVVAVWGRDRFGLSADDYNRRTQCYKRLTRLWEDPVVGASHPLAAAQGAIWDQANTVLIDDSAEKARSEPHNAVTLPEFAGDLAENPQVLPLVEEYLDTLAMQTDVSTYIRVKPFTMR